MATCTAIKHQERKRSIRIDTRHRPFTHASATRCILPGSPLVIVVYPTRIEVEGIASLMLQQTPMEGFTVQYDSLKGVVRIFGRDRAYRVWHEGATLHCFDEKAKTLQELDVSCQAFTRQLTPRLSFGCHKKQDMAMIARRCDEREFLPMLYELGIPYPKPDVLDREGSGALLHAIAEALAAFDKKAIAPLFRRFFHVAMSGLFVPKCEDDLHLGYIQGQCAALPYELLGYSAQLIEAMIFQQRGARYCVLPCLPPEIYCGRLVGLSKGALRVSLEWSKKRLRRMEITALEEGEYTIEWPKDIRSYRCDTKRVVDRETPLALMQGQTVFLDRFTR